MLDPIPPSAQPAEEAPDVPLTPPGPADQDTIAALDALIADAGADPADHRSKNIREIMHTALKLVRDGSDTGEVKLISRSMKELRYALKVFRPYRDTPKISIFGSARTPEDHPDYVAAVDVSKAMAAAGWMVITGAGDGIMRAGHGGAGKEASFGVAIRLPFETNANDFIVGDPKLITFRYFFTRKLMFMWESAAIALFPGGFGTQDEGFEALTLIQTGKAPLVPIVLVDAPRQRTTAATGTGSTGTTTSPGPSWTTAGSARPTATFTSSPTTPTPPPVTSWTSTETTTRSASSRTTWSSA